MLRAGSSRLVKSCLLGLVLALALAATYTSSLIVQRQQAFVAATHAARAATSQDNAGDVLALGPRA